MSTPLRTRSIVAVAVLGLAGAASAGADPVSSPKTAWAPLPARAIAALEGSVEQRGRDVFRERCAACHAAVPQNMIGPPYMPPMPGTFALRARYQGAKPAELEERTDLTPEFVKAIVRNGLNSMPPFRPTELGNDDLDALGRYLARKDR